MADQSSASTQAEALRDLVQSSGWTLYREMVLQEIAGDFEDHITKALDERDGTIALDRMRQVAAVRKAGLRWLRLPQERIEALTSQVEHQEEIAQPRVGRRPVGL